MSDFERQYRETQERVERLRNQIDAIKNAPPGTSVASQKYLMKATHATLQTDLMNFDQLMDSYKNMPHKHQGLSKKDMNKRIDLINEISDLIRGQLEQEYRALENSQAALARQ